MDSVNTMELIRKKMTMMKAEKDQAYVKAEALEHKVAEQKALNDQQEGEIQNLQKTIAQMEGELDEVQTALTEATTKLETTEKTLSNAENDVGGLSRRIKLLEVDFEETSQRLATASVKLEEASKFAEESEKNRKALESRSLADDERLTFLETQLKEAKYQ